MSVAVAAASVFVEALKSLAGSGAAALTVTIPATANGKGLDGIAAVRNWPGGWNVNQHAKNVMACVAKGWIGPWRWVPVQVDPRLTILAAHDALSIGTNPHCRIPINQSGAQRLLDELGRQAGKRMLMPTPKIADAIHLAAVKSGRAVEQVSIWKVGAVPEPIPTGKTQAENRGPDVTQWLRQQERIQKAVAAAGGYPASGCLSTTGKHLVLAPSTPDRLSATDPGEEKGPKLCIYGWNRRKDGPRDPHLQAALTAAGWPKIEQQESFAHVDADTDAGIFWDYSQILVPVLDDCLVDGQPAKLSVVYQQQSELVYCFRGATPRPIPARYPRVPAPIGAT